MRGGPPKLAAWLVRMAAPRSSRRSILEDLREEFDSMLGAGVPLADARRWYWRQALESVVPLVTARRGPAGLTWDFLGSEGGVLQDIKIGARSLRKRPGFTLIVVCTLALGIGATSAVFSLVQGVLLTPPPYEDPDRLVLVDPVYVDGREGRAPDWAPVQWLDWRDRSERFESLAAYMWAFNFLVSDEGSESLEGMRVTHDYFEVTGLEPALGRVFDGTETGGSEAPPAIILGHDLWMTRFGGDPGVLGQTLRISRTSTPPVVVGVMPPGVRFLPSPRTAQEPNYDVDATVDYWIPGEVTRASDERLLGSRAWNVVGRLAQGASAASAEAELTTLAEEQATVEPAYDGIAPAVEPLVAVMNGEARRILLPLLGAAALVLLIGCGNAAALLLVRGLHRRQEYGVRGAIGAGRLALLRLVSAESLILAVAGGVLGVGLAHGAVRGFKAVAGHAIPRLDAVSTGWPVLLFGLGAALVATVVAGLYPAWRATRESATQSLEGAGRRTTASRGERRFLAGVTALQAALTLTLLVGAGLLVRSMGHLARVDSGFDVERVLTMSVTAVTGDWEDFHHRALETVLDMPAVEHAAFAWGVPLTGNNWPGDVGIEGREVTSRAEERVAIPVRSVTRGYFTLLGQTILEGRDFTAADDGEGTRVAVVNQAFVERYLGGATPLGRTFTRRQGGPAFQIVGVVSDSRTDDLTRGATPEIYLSLWQAGAFSKHLVVRTAGDPSTTALAVQRALSGVDPTVSVENVMTLGDIRGDSLASRTFAMQLLIGFALVACILTLGGIYGMLSLTVASRSREIAIRTAVGAERRNVLELVLGEGLRVIAVGVGLGLAGAVGLSRALEAFLFEVEPTDPLTLLAVGSSFALVAVLATWLPARRAAAVDPARALREE